jgi:uncharacterized protein DUF5666
MFRPVTLSTLLAIAVCGCSSSHSVGPASTPARAGTGALPLPPSPSPLWTGGNLYDHFGLAQGAGIAGLRFDTWAGCPVQRFDVVCVDSVLADGQPQDLKSIDGKVISVHAKVSPTENKATIEVRRAIVGPVEAVDFEHAHATVMGQEVFLYQASADWSALVVGALVEVNGYIGLTGQVYATRVDLAPPGPYVLRGILGRGAGGHFSLGALDVDVSAAEIAGFPAHSPVVGDPVVMISSRPPVAGLFVADSVRFEGGDWNQLSIWENHAEDLLEGIVTAKRSEVDFDVGGRRVLLDTCSCGPTALPPAVGTPLSLHSVLDYGGTALVSTNIGTYVNTLLTGPIEQIDADTRRLKVLGFDVQALPATYVSSISSSIAGDASDIAGNQLSFSDLKLGDAVDISGEALGQLLVASSIGRSRTVPRIYGDMFRSDYPNLSVLGQTIVVDRNTVIVHNPDEVVPDLASYRTGGRLPLLFTVDLASPTPPLRATRILIELL